ncbi:KilA-N domain-containing protein [Serratia marcescens]|uniref:KilA-N domain-containing protein n=1 Tax=Serratia marcescens TaxID=615 RepID=UPI0029D70215|nr:KilA-N domain-containing protein [Serratia marcescens]MDX7275480.1 KilA-N domain-containing protein [Serratia marcescens]
MTALNLANNAGAVTIAGVEISTDSEGRFNLNALHKASGMGESKEPNKWLRNKQAQELIAELSANLSVAQEVIKTVKGGIAPGTYAHQLLAVSYAGWISPAFQLQVNQAFIDYRTGKQSPAVDPLAALNDPEFLRGALLTYSEKVIALESTNKELVSQVEHMENLFKDGMTPTQFCKMLNGVNVMQVCRYLEGRKWLYNESKTGTRWRTGSYARDKYLTEHQSKVSVHGGEEFVKFTPVLLHKGAVRIYQLYLRGQLPMKNNWNGVFTHDKELKGAA